MSPATSSLIALIGGTVIDGTGAPARAATVVIAGDHIKTIGGAAPDGRMIFREGRKLVDRS